MEAKVRATGEIVKVITKNITGTHTKCEQSVISHKVEKWYKNNEIVIIDDNSNDIDWEQRRFELVKAAMPIMMQIPTIKSADEFRNFVAETSIEYADAVIAKLKEDSK